MFDWIVPDEWNLRDAYIATADGTRVVDYRDSTLHVVSYSEPVRTTLSLDGAARAAAHAARTAERDPLPDLLLRAHLGLLPLSPPPARAGAGRLRGGDRFDARAGPPDLRGTRDRGRGEGEVLISTYVCHPSLANDNLSGIAVATMLAKRLLGAAPAPHLPFPLRPARSGRSPGSIKPRRPGSHRARPHPVVHRRRRRPHLQALATRGRRGRPRGRDRAPRLGFARTACCRGSRGAATSASSAPRGSTSPLAR